jgi:hypothetical protein
MKKISKLILGAVFALAFCVSCEETGDSEKEINRNVPQTVVVPKTLTKTLEDENAKITASGLPIISKLKTKDSVITIISSPDGPIGVNRMHRRIPIERGSVESVGGVCVYCSERDGPSSVPMPQACRRDRTG